MAILLLENFEWYDPTIGTQRYSAVAASGQMNTTTANAAMFGKCLGIASGASSMFYALYYELGTTYSSGFVSLAYSSVSALQTVALPITAVRNGSTIQLALRRETDNRISVARNTTVLQTTTDPILIRPNFRYRLEFGYVINATTGSYRVDVNGVTVLNGTGANTRNGVDGVTNVGFGNSNMTSYIDDILIDTDSAAFRGDWTIRSVYPSADAVGFSTPSTGSRWSNIGNAPATGTAYNTFSSAGADRYDLTDLPANAASIFAVGAIHRVLKTDTGTCTFRTRLKSGASYGNGTTRASNVAAAIYQDTFETDPQGGGSWTPTRVNELQAEAERVS